jgi:hypothetical protein
MPGQFTLAGCAAAVLSQIAERIEAYVAIIPANLELLLPDFFQFYGRGAWHYSSMISSGLAPKFAMLICAASFSVI